MRASIVAAKDEIKRARAACKKIKNKLAEVADLIAWSGFCVAHVYRPSMVEKWRPERRLHHVLRKPDGCDRGCGGHAYVILVPVDVHMLNTVDCCRRLRSRLPAEQRRPKPPAAVVLFTCIINILYDEHGTKALIPSIQ